MIDTTTTARSGLFYGWWIIAVTVVGLSLSVGPLLVLTFGVFAIPLGSHLGASRGEMSLSIAFLNSMVALGSPFAGRLTDRFGGRRVIVSSMIGLAICLWLLAAFTNSLLQLYTLYLVAGLVGSGGAPVTYSRVVANWFDRQRGLALGFTSAGIGLGAAIMPSLAQYLIDNWGGWRTAFASLGVVTVVVGVPVVAFFLRNSPEEMGLVPDGDSSVASPTPRTHSGMGTGEALRTRTFWQLAIVFFAVAAAVNGASTHLVPMLIGRGSTGAFAAFAASVYGTATIAGRIGNGFIVDSVFAPYVAAVTFAAGAGGVWMLASGAVGGQGLIAAILLGLAIGAESEVMPYLVSRYFGMKSMGTLFGFTFGAYLFGSAAGTYLMGVGFDVTGSYTTPLTVAVGVLLLAAVVMLLLPRYRRWDAAAT